jgi:hypothetical protein
MPHIPHSVTDLTRLSRGVRAHLGNNRRLDLNLDPPTGWEGERVGA